MHDVIVMLWCEGCLPCCCGGRYAGSLETSYDRDEPAPNWEIDPATLEIGPKVGQGEFGSVHKVGLR